MYFGTYESVKLSIDCDGEDMEYLLTYIVIINLLGFASMYIDKKRAINSRHRIKESTLWTIALAGGAIGSSIGMKRFRHKTKHKSFTVGFPLLAFIDVALFVYVMYLLGY